MPHPHGRPSRLRRRDVVILGAVILAATGTGVLSAYAALSGLGHLSRAGNAASVSRSHGRPPGHNPARLPAQPSDGTSPSASAGPAPGSPPSPGRLINCAGQPHLCGYPDQADTGVPAGTQRQEVPQQVKSGPGWHWDPRGWIVADKPGAVISHISVNATVSVEAPDVTIADSSINCTGGCNFNVIIRDGTTNNGVNADNVLIEDTTIADTSHTSPVGIEAEAVSNTRILRDNVWGEGTGVLFAGGGGQVENSYIHDLAVCCGYHNEDFQTTAGGNAVLEHNTLFNQESQTADVMITQDFGAQTNVTVDGNLMAGGGYSVYGGDTGQSAGVPATYIRITNNRLSNLFYSKCGYYGWLTAFNSPPGAGNVVDGNYWDATGKPAT